MTVNRIVTCIPLHKAVTPCFLYHLYKNMWPTNVVSVTFPVASMQWEIPKVPGVVSSQEKGPFNKEKRQAIQEFCTTFFVTVQPTKLF